MGFVHKTRRCILSSFDSVASESLSTHMSLLEPALKDRRPHQRRKRKYIWLVPLPFIGRVSMTTSGVDLWPKSTIHLTRNPVVMNSGTVLVLLTV